MWGGSNGKLKDPSVSLTAASSPFRESLYELSPLGESGKCIAFVERGFGNAECRIKCKMQSAECRIVGSKAPDFIRLSQF